MKIIDIHTHVGDLIFGTNQPSYMPHERYSEPPRWAYTLEECDFDIERMKDVVSPEMMRYYDGMIALGDRGLRILEAVFNQDKANAATINNLLASMKKNKVTHSVILPIEPLVITDESLQISKKNKCLLAFASVHPKDPEKIEKIRRYMKSGARGLKIHPVVQGIHPSDPSILELMEEYRKFGRPVLFHTGESTYYVTQSEEQRQLARLENFEKVISQFPGTNFILGHMGQQMQRDEALGLGEKYKNVYVDCSLQPLDGVKEALSRIGENRMLYGSDFPFSLQEPHIRIISRLAGEDSRLKEKIFYKNAERLIGPVDEV